MIPTFYCHLYQILLNLFLENLCSSFEPVADFPSSPFLHLFHFYNEHLLFHDIKMEHCFMPQNKV